jgi:hypothetical protein
MDHNPFVPPDTDPRAKQIQEARDAQKAGVAATTSLVPDWEKLKELTTWMANSGTYDAMDVAEAITDPARFWEYMEASKHDQ